MNKIIVSALIGLIAVSGTMAQEEILGAGATFPYPLYSKMFNEYYAKKQIKVNYQSIGSGGGVKQIMGETVDFGATDAFIGDTQLKEAKRPLVHIPMVLGSVTVSYNLEGVKSLRLTPGVLADIFLGKITDWSDPKLASINPGVKLPNKKIVVVHRSDGSGTSSIFTDYLAKVSPEWKKNVGAGKSVNWPAGLGAKGNEGVAGLVKQMPGSIGYMELAYTRQNKMPVATMQNKAGKWIVPDLASTSAAAQGTIPVDTRVNLTNSDAKDAYPIAGFTWIVVYQDQNYGGRTKAKAKALANLLWWMLHDGRQYSEALDYANLPAATLTKAETILKGLTYGKEKLF
ncbi:MAG TPA: phosphate ABC transporter substrate-binding protein PstS [Fibrobacteraceae bacterium]|nr:phosphate ABC transporter substrate-binding protein PstS [Fibrobacteraceae bacterium]